MVTDVVIGEAALEEETEKTVALAAGGVDETGEDTEIIGFIDRIEGFADRRFGQLERTKTRLNLEFAPGLVFEFVMHIGVAKTIVVEKVVGIETLPDFIEQIRRCAPFKKLAADISGTMFRTGTIGFGFIKPFGLGQFSVCHRYRCECVYRYNLIV